MSWSHLSKAVLCLVTVWGVCTARWGLSFVQGSVSSATLCCLGSRAGFLLCLVPVLLGWALHMCSTWHILKVHDTFWMYLAHFGVSVFTLPVKFNSVMPMQELCCSPAAAVPCAWPGRMGPQCLCWLLVGWWLLSPAQSSRPTACSESNLNKSGFVNSLHADCWLGFLDLCLEERCFWRWAMENNVQHSFADVN